MFEEFFFKNLLIGLNWSDKRSRSQKKLTVDIQCARAILFFENLGWDLRTKKKQRTSGFFSVDPTSIYDS
ncbi:hypothetical protein CH376_06065 [Leptospira adleri]|uniref:Uncharacterized protein n=1 Tax=Leptospira adleri TaxID=2023186 RepID=A0ABX4P197_9LEPT|nr:hypothetical protein CH376_06065 [Leptospira adleri]